MSPQESFDRLATTLTGYRTALDRYSDEQFFHKPAADVWSLGQLYEHLAVSSTYYFLANIKRCLEQRKGQEGGAMNANAEQVYANNGFPPIKIKVPQEIRGPEPVAQSREAYKVLFSQLLHDAAAFVEPVAQDAGQYKTLHPPFGYLNAAEWFRLLEMHTRHHLRQQKELEALVAA